MPRQKNDVVLLRDAGIHATRVTIYHIVTSVKHMALRKSSLTFFAAKIADLLEDLAAGDERLARKLREG